MKDFCGKELKHNDLVASKPGGRHAYMQLGLIRDELASVWFSPESKGGSDMIKIDTEGYSHLEEKRLKMVAEREEEIKERLKLKNEKKNKKIPKSKMKRFGVYESEDEYDREIFLGKCSINGKIIENVWMLIEGAFYKGDGRRHIKFPEDEDLNFWTKNIYPYRPAPQKHRTVKYPQKFKEICVLSEKKVKQLQSESREKLEKVDYSTSNNFIQVIFD